MERILVVEDELSISTLLKFNLEKAGYAVITSLDGKEGLELARSESPDLILLDLMLPSMDGMEICKTLRTEKNHTPILMLTARDGEHDKIVGLELGADDYLTKPFSPRELVARVKAILRRSKQMQEVVSPEEEKTTRIGPFIIDSEKYETTYAGTRIELTPKEFELLLYLAKNQSKVLTRDHLLNAVWNYDYLGDSRIVDVHISHLREKLEEDTRNPKYIKTVRGLGYKFEV
ncbi:DNA-binding response regulator [Ammoniphilus oxalaticus]|uniref:DNA-binding response regulator n=1 Tax=Ammoniphilus oxalaticus TaxID=66863 RepID=A0A419SIP4_9BACL|nr:response regulator transcription factor [Ammoniphilus oxalaticus]RKD23788.1 DNA-binding response regulator [Ammoniphilus oxalaticus]